MLPLNTPDKAPFRRVETLWSAGRIPLEITQFDLPPHEDPDPVSENFILCLALRGTVRAGFRLPGGWAPRRCPAGEFHAHHAAAHLGRARHGRAAPASDARFADAGCRRG